MTSADAPSTSASWKQSIHAPSCQITLRHGQTPCSRFLHTASTTSAGSPCRIARIRLALSSMPVSSPEASFGGAACGGGDARWRSAVVLSWYTSISLCNASCAHNHRPNCRQSARTLPMHIVTVAQPAASNGILMCPGGTKTEGGATCFAFAARSLAANSSTCSNTSVKTEQHAATTMRHFKQREHMSGAEHKKAKGWPTQNPSMQACQTAERHDRRAPWLEEVRVRTLVSTARRARTPDRFLADQMILDFPVLALRTSAEQDGWSPTNKAMQRRSSLRERLHLRLGLQIGKVGQLGLLCIALPPQRNPVTLLKRGRRNWASF